MSRMIDKGDYLAMVVRQVLGPDDTMQVGLHQFLDDCDKMNTRNGGDRIYVQYISLKESIEEGLMMSKIEMI